jgi:uncharacterized protein (DUF2249 family)
MNQEKVVDARGLEPPRPFELVMTGLCDLAPDETLVVRVDRDPVPLYRVLRQNGYEWTTTGSPERGFVVRIRAASAGGP